MISAPDQSRELFFGGTAESHASNGLLEGDRDSVRSSEVLTQIQTLTVNPDSPHSSAERTGWVEETI